MSSAKPRGRVPEALAAVDKLECPDLSALVRLAMRDEPVNFRQFAVAAQVSPKSAIRVRERLEELGLLRIEVAREQGPAEVLEISLTPLGRRVAKQLLAVEEMLARAR